MRQKHRNAPRNAAEGEEEGCRLVNMNVNNAGFKHLRNYGFSKSF